MDRSFLSQPEVIAASRNFVCVRLTTYENEAEAEFMRHLFLGRSGDVENTTFAILAPDGKERLVRPGRSTNFAFRDAADMAQGMNAIAQRYPAKGEAAATALPVTHDARLGLDVAASDGQPLVVILAADPAARAALEAKVARLAWGREFIGQFVYATAAAPKDVPGTPGLAAADGVAVIEPDTFGQKGKVVKQVPAGAPAEDLAAALREALAHHTRVIKNSRTHREQGIQEGAFWDTKLPVGDREEANARERTRQQMGRKQP